LETPETYIFDTSVLIAFSNLQKRDLLCRLYEKILITGSVQLEFAEELPDCSEIIEVNHELVESFRERMNIGSGEASVIIFALKYTENVICFIDEQRARKIAKKHQLKVSGTIGILMKMEGKRLILSAYEEVLRLKEKGFYVSNEIIENLKISAVSQ
jgi:predicted nucleic acid-binding protein